MFDLTLVRDALVSDVSALEQVILPESVGSQSIDTAEVLVSLVSSHVTGCVAPLILPDEPDYPTAVYQQISSDVLEVEGYPILRDDGYMLRISDPVYGTMRDTAESVRISLLGYATGAGTVSIEDQADKHDEKLSLFETGIAIRMTHLALTSQSGPAAFVYVDAHDVSPIKRYGDVETDENTRVSVLVVARIPTNGVSALATLLGEIQSSVMDVTDTGWNRPVWYGGEVVAIHNSLVLWKENFAFPRSREFINP